LSVAVRDSLDEALRAAEHLQADHAAALQAAARDAFTSALRAVLTGVGLLWIATGLLIWRRRPIAGTAV
jgi:hypothetical protein